MTPFYTLATGGPERFEDSTVFHDVDADTLNGKAGDDWFFRKPPQDVTDGIGGEAETG